MMKTSVLYLQMSKCSYCGVDFTPHRLHPNSKKCPSKECTQKYKNSWARQNPECKLKWLENNPIKRAKASKEYTQRNRPYYAEYSALRTRKAKQAKPKWLDEWQLFYIEELYSIASLRGLEVDHIVPITSKRVCGLHVPWNLQLLTRSENAKKSNKFNEDLVGVLENE